MQAHQAACYLSYHHSQASLVKGLSKRKARGDSRARTHRFSSLFSSKSFIVLHSSLNKFRINFCVWWGNKGWSSCFTDTHPVVKSNISFPHWIILPFRQKYVWIFFWILFSIPLFFISIPIPHCPDYCSFTLELWNQVV